MGAPGPKGDRGYPGPRGETGMLEENWMLTARGENLFFVLGAMCHPGPPLNVNTPLDSITLSCSTVYLLVVPCPVKLEHWTKTEGLMLWLFLQARPGRRGPQDYQGSTPSSASNAWRREMKVRSLTDTDLQHAVSSAGGRWDRSALHLMSLRQLSVVTRATVYECASGNHCQVRGCTHPQPREQLANSLAWC